MAPSPVPTTEPTSAPTDVPTFVPSPMPTTSACQYTFLPCGSTVTGTNVGQASYTGSASGDVNYLIPLYEPKTIVASTCFDITNFRTRMTLFDRCPTNVLATVDGIVFTVGDLSATQSARVAGNYTISSTDLTSNNVPAVTLIRSKIKTIGSISGADSDRVAGTYVVAGTSSGYSKDWRAITTSLDGTKSAAVVLNGYIWISTDSGANWVSTATSQAWSSIASSDDLSILAAVVDNGDIYTSSDGGDSWVVRSVPVMGNPPMSWSGVASSATGTRLIAVTRSSPSPFMGHLFTSSDSGNIWTSRVTGSLKPIVAVVSSANGAKLAFAEDDGAIWTSTNFGAAWTERQNEELLP